MGCQVLMTSCTYSQQYNLKDTPRRASATTTIPDAKVSKFFCHESCDPARLLHSLKFDPLGN